MGHEQKSAKNLIPVLSDEGVLKHPIGPFPSSLSLLFFEIWQPKLARRLFIIQTMNFQHSSLISAVVIAAGAWLAL